MSTTKIILVIVGTLLTVPVFSSPLFTPEEGFGDQKSSDLTFKQHVSQQETLQTIQNILLDTLDTIKSHEVYSKGILEMLDSDTAEAQKFKISLLPNGSPDKININALKNDLIQDLGLWTFAGGLVNVLFQHTNDVQYLYSQSWLNYCKNTFSEVKYALKLAKASCATAVNRYGKDLPLTDDNEVAAPSEVARLMKNARNNDGIIIALGSNQNVNFRKEIPNSNALFYLLSEQTTWEVVRFNLDSILQNFDKKNTFNAAIRIPEYLNFNKKLVAEKQKILNLSEKKDKSSKRLYEVKSNNIKSLEKECLELLEPFKWENYTREPENQPAVKNEKSKKSNKKNKNSRKPHTFIVISQKDELDEEIFSTSPTEISMLPQKQEETDHLIEDTKNGPKHFSINTSLTEIDLDQQIEKNIEKGSNVEIEIEELPIGTAFNIKNPKYLRELRRQKGSMTSFKSELNAFTLLPITLNSDDYNLLSAIWKPTSQNMPQWGSFLKVMGHIILQVGGKINTTGHNGSSVSFTVEGRRFSVHGSHKDLYMYFDQINLFVKPGLEYVGITPERVKVKN